MRIARRPVLLLVALIAFEIILIVGVDRPVSDVMRGLETTHPAIIDFFRAITDFGKSKWYLWPSGLAILAGAAMLHTPFLLGSQHPRIAQTCHHLSLFFISIALSGIVTDIVKPIIGRARPVERLREHLYAFRPWTFDAAWNGMPSGHATTAGALATALVILAPRGRIVWIALGLILAVSRIMVNAHYLSDVAAGSLVGILTTLGLARQRDAQGMFPLMKGIFPIDKRPPAP